jgi:hypothetical protein
MHFSGVTPDIWWLPIVITGIITPIGAILILLAKTLVERRDTPVKMPFKRATERLGYWKIRLEIEPLLGPRPRTLQMLRNQI